MSDADEELLQRIIREGKARTITTEQILEMQQSTQEEVESKIKTEIISETSESSKTSETPETPKTPEAEAEINLPKKFTIKSANGWFEGTNSKKLFLCFEIAEPTDRKTHLKKMPERESSELEKNIEKILDVQPGISSYAIAQKILPPNKKFESFRVTVSRIVKRIRNRRNVT